MEEEGLNKREAESLLIKYGPNEIEDIGRISLSRILTRQIKKNFVVYLLLATAIISFFVDKPVTGYTLLGIIAIVISVGFLQEYRAETAINELRKMITQVSIVIRDKKQLEIPSNQIVPGDILVLKNGERIPADCVIIEHNELRVNESILTGESSEVPKKEQDGQIKPENVIYLGTFVVNGRATARVIHTGMSTKFGKIAGLISREEKELPLQDKVNLIAKYLVVLGICFAILTGIIFLLREEAITSQNVMETLLIIIALSVAAFPESFPVVLITTLSSGAYRMARKNAIVNRMSVIETLGETTVICSDKTGTLTKGEMTVKQIFVDNSCIEVTGSGYNAEGSFKIDGKEYKLHKNPVISLLHKAAVLCNDASIISSTGKEYKINGTPTEASLLMMAAKAGISKEDLSATRKAEIPFSSSRKLMSVLVKLNKDNLIFTKGAPELVMERCSKIQRSNGAFTLNAREKERILHDSCITNEKAYRTLAIAYKPVSNSIKNIEEKNLIFIGIVAIEDAPREEVVEAIRICNHAGIKVKMITGDNRDTALSIANQIGLYGKIITGDELDSLSDSELTAKVTEITIFARVKPEHKLRIVKALKENGEVVTMTGDGVNDAPALKSAHVGVAMGKNGTDVSRSVADLTLKDDNFSTIVEAIKEGRTILNNMKKFISYQLSCNVAETIAIFLGVLLGFPLPLVAIQILFMNMVTSDIPAISLGLNPSSDDVMDRPPRRKVKLVTKDHARIIAIAGIIIGIGTLSVFLYSYYVLHQGLAYARTCALVTLIGFELAHAFNFRSFRKGVLNRSPFVNRTLVYTALISIIATLAIIYTPLNKFFETVPLTMHSLLIAIIPCLFIVIIFDLLKAINNKYMIWPELR